jgi:hypothetical protein
VRKGPQPLTSELVASTEGGGDLSPMDRSTVGSSCGSGGCYGRPCLRAGVSAFLLRTRFQGTWVQGVGDSMG